MRFAGKPALDSGLSVSNGAAMQMPYQIVWVTSGNHQRNQKTLRGGAR
jgi:hypothetical protein